MLMRLHCTRNIWMMKKKSQKVKKLQKMQKCRSGRFLLKTWAKSQCVSCVSSALQIAWNITRYGPIMIGASQKAEKKDTKALKNGVVESPFGLGLRLGLHVQHTWSGWLTTKYYCILFYLFQKINDTYDFQRRNFVWMWNWGSPMDRKQAGSLYEA